MNYYTRRQLVVRLRVGQDFLIALEEEEIVSCDAPEGIAGVAKCGVASTNLDSP